MFEDDELGIEKLLFNLSALSDLGEEITSPNEFQRIVKSSLYLIMGTFSVSKGAIFQYDPDKMELSHLVSKGLGEIKDAKVTIVTETVNHMVKANHLISAINSGPADIKIGEDAFIEKIKADIIIPIVARGELLGILTLGDRLSDEKYSKNDKKILSIMIQQIALSLHNHTIFHRLNRKNEENMKESLYHIYYGTIHALAAAIDAKDAYTRGHSHRVSAYCVAMAEGLGWGKTDKEGLRVAGLLHDIGKIAVEKSIINKTSDLSNDEIKELNRHPLIGYQILSRAKFPWEGVPEIVRNHHEKVNGRGYPDGLKGADISRGARIMALADAFDAMTTDRPYRKQLPLETALLEIKKHINIQFDTEAASAFFSVLKKEIKGETEEPVILPYIHGPIDKIKIGRLLDGLTGNA